MKYASVFTEKTLAFCLLLSVFILFPDLPLWAFASSVIFWFYRLILDRLTWRIPSRWITGGFSALFLVITYFNYKTLVGSEPSCAFLVVLMSLKILEYREPKEKGFLVLLGLYLFVSKFLFDTDFLWFSIGFPSMILLLFHLLPESFRRRNQRSASLFTIQSLLLSLPLGLFLFFYFPRFSADMFMMQSQTKNITRVGFSEDIQPGSVASLAQNDDLVFRAEFKNFKPTVNSMYWRGLILSRPNGMAWERNTDLDPDRPIYQNLLNTDPQVRITLEPNFKPWLFTLEQSSKVQSDQLQILTNNMGVFKSAALIEKRVVYTVLPAKENTHPSDGKDPKIMLPETQNKQTQNLLRNLQRGAKTPEDLVNNIADFLVKEQFTYTTSPGDDGKLTLDDFLFKTKKGFCEHFASATALLLNHLKVPAHVVAGYHGGEFNPIGRFWTIKQSDAHAWIEYLDKNKNWHRFDPTAVIAPLRIALGADIYQRIQDGSFNPEQLKALGAEATNNEISKKLFFYLDNLNYQWNSAFINFDIDKQKELLKEMDINIGLAILIGMLITLIMSLSLSWLFRVRQKLPRSTRIFNLINFALDQHNLGKEPTEGILAWTDRIAQAFPAKEKELRALLDCYIKEAYCNKPSKDNMIRARQIIKDLW